MQRQVMTESAVGTQQTTQAFDRQRADPIDDNGLGNSGPPRIGAAIRAEMARIGTLTAREREVSVVVAEGLTNKQIGQRLFVSPITVRHHLSAIFRKLRVQTRFELIVLCYRYELVGLPEVGKVPPSLPMEASLAPVHQAAERNRFGSAPQTSPGAGSPGEVCGRGRRQQ